jgi:hypothetical protein
MRTQVEGKKGPKKQNVPVKAGTQFPTNKSLPQNKILSRAIFNFFEDFFIAVFSRTSPI